MKPTHLLTKIYDVFGMMIKLFHFLIMILIVPKFDLDSILFVRHFFKFQFWNILRSEFHVIEMNEMVLD